MPEPKHVSNLRNGKDVLLRFLIHEAAEVSASVEILWAAIDVDNIVRSVDPRRLVLDLDCRRSRPWNDWLQVQDLRIETVQGPPSSLGLVRGGRCCSPFRLRTSHNFLLLNFL